jgi:hypothetical protein
MRDFQSELAREVNRLTGWSGSVFERRYEMTVVTNEDRARSSDFPREEVCPDRRRGLSNKRFIPASTRSRRLR